MPLPGRLALRDLGRYQARSGAALAAISLALGIAMTIVIATSIAKDPASEGNLSPNQMLIFGGTSKAVLGGASVRGEARAVGPTSLESSPEQQRAIDRIAGLLDDPSVIDLHVAIDPTWLTEPDPDGDPGPFPIDAGRPEPGPDGGVSFDKGNLVPLVVGTPELLAHYDLDAADIPADADVVSARSYGQGFQFLNLLDSDKTATSRVDAPTFRTVDELPRYTSLPTDLLTPQSVRDHGWSEMHRGWLIESASPLTDEQIADALEIAAGAGIEFETRSDQTTMTNLRTGAIVGGALLALGILAMTIGLIRAEAAADIRTLSAAGGTRAVRRRLTAATAAALAALGVLIGTVGAYVFLAAWFHDDLGRLSRVPVLHLAIALLGLPLLAGLGGLLFAGREPSAISRRAIE